MNIWVKQRGKTLGPLPLDKVLAAFNAGKFAANAEISDDQVTWRPVSDLARLGHRTAPAAPAEPTPAPMSAVQQPPAPANYGQPMQPTGYPQQPMQGQPMQPDYGQPMQGQPMQPGYGQPMQPAGYQQPMQDPGVPGQTGTYCRSCGSPVTPQAAICMRCGASPKAGNAFCPTCGSPTNPAQAICLKCGCALGGSPIGGKKIAPSGKSASTAMILSCFFAGVGQIYLGQTTKGVLILVIFYIFWPIGFFAFGLLWIIILPIIGVIQFIDALMIGKKLESGQSVGEWEFF